MLPQPQLFFHIHLPLKDKSPGEFSVISCCLEQETLINELWNWLHAAVQDICGATTESPTAAG